MNSKFNFFKFTLTKHNKTMKKQLLTTALVSSILGFGITSAVAQTTVTGNLELSYSATSNEGNATAAQKIKNVRGFGKESQINIANKGKLSNGMDYAAGFSFEVDGIDTGSQGMWNENTYIDLTSGKTTITIGADHIQNPDRNVTNLVGFGYLGIDGLNDVISSYSKSVGSGYSAYGIGLVQDIGIGKISANYMPDATGGAASNDVLNGLQSTQIDTAESQVEVGFKGGLGVKGLDLGLFYNKQDKVAGTQATANDIKGVRFDGSYNLGQVTVAFDYAKQQGITTGTGTTSAYTAGLNEHKMKSAGIAYAVDKDISLGYTYGVAETNAASKSDEKINLFAVGYNLGPVTAQLQYKKVDNHANVTGYDGEQVSARLATKF